MKQIAPHIAEAVAEYVIEPGRTRLLDTVSACGNVASVNEELRRLTGVRQFFPDDESLGEFRRVLTQGATAEPRASREWGDFQTPPDLADRVCNYLVKTGISPRVIIEPTCGAGNLVLAALKAFPAAGLVYGVEIQSKYEWHLKLALLSEAWCGRYFLAEIELRQDDIFTHRFSDEMFRAQDNLIIGNPPWVTSAELGTLNAGNLPAKRNVKALNGLDAITGKSNFDIGEFVLLRMLDLFSKQRGTLAMLCKNSVIKNIVEALPQRQYEVSNIRALKIDASREFGAAVDASLLVMDMGASTPTFTCQAATLGHPDRVSRTFGWMRNRFVSNVREYEAIAELDGKSPLVWRQGLKHDCARIMELDAQGDHWVNGDGEVADVEGEWVYGLLKSSDLRQFEVGTARKRVIVTQRRLDEDTTGLQKSAPKLWEYLVRNSEHFERRKSSIYRGRPRFAIFGIGDYSFAAYKVAISGLYKEPRFSLVLPIDGRPLLLDDTCYLLSFDAYPDALFTASLLNSQVVKQFLQSVVFADAKRPYTKQVLMRIDLVQVASRLSWDALEASWAEIGYKPRMPVSMSDFEEYQRRLLKVGASQSDLQIGLGI